VGARARHRVLIDDDSEEEPMSEEDTTKQPPEGEPPAGDDDGRRPRRLLRSRSDRMIAGVAGGLGRYFGVDPVILRIVFAISVFLGGLGVLAYVALALFVPTGDDEGDEVEAPPIERSRGLAIAVGLGVLVLALSWGIFDGGFFWDGDGWFFGPPLLVIALAAAVYLIVRETRGTSPLGIVGRIFLAILAVCVLFAAAVASAWAGATGHGVVIALVIVGIGALLAASAFRGGARWLIVPAVVLAVPLAAVAAADIRFADGVGEREYRPATAASIPADGYELGIGRLEVDLRELDWEREGVVDLDTDLGLGKTVIAVPESVCVDGMVEAKAGNVTVAGTSSDGVEPELTPDPPVGARPLLQLDARVDLGRIIVANDDDLDLEELEDDHDHWDDDDDERDDERTAAMDEACAVTPAERPAERR
jgi:phage shock protein PspC (stress-responsive transcriptional regulator)